MTELKDLETADLVDMLVFQTATYTKMLAEDSTGIEFQNCKQLISYLQEEIRKRKQQNPLVPPLSS